MLKQRYNQDKIHLIFLYKGKEFNDDDDGINCRLFTKFSHYFWDIPEVQVIIFSEQLELRKKLTGSKNLKKLFTQTPILNLSKILINENKREFQDKNSVFSVNQLSALKAVQSGIAAIFVGDGNRNRKNSYLISNKNVSSVKKFCRCIHKHKKRKISQERL